MAGKNVKPVQDKPVGIYVKWQDAYMPDIGWIEWSDALSIETRSEGLCEAMGWLVEETTAGVVVSVCISGTGFTKVATPLFIPIGCIIERKDIP